MVKLTGLSFYTNNSTAHMNQRSARKNLFAGKNQAVTTADTLIIIPFLRYAFRTIKPQFFRK